MKIARIEIKDFRGIRDLVLEPNGGNTVVWGPNGTGKSGVVDAIDFLLTGELSRISGSGTKGISLKSYGPHVDMKPADAVVSGVFLAPSQNATIRLTRTIANPKSVKVDPPNTAGIEQRLSEAQKRPYILTRRDILRFVASEASNRAKQIQELLDLTFISKWRATANQFANTSSRQHKESEANRKSSLERVAASLGLVGFDETKVLETINDHRIAVGYTAAGTIDEVLSDSDFEDSVGQSRAQVDPNNVLTHLHAQITKTRDGFTESWFDDLVASINEIAKNEKLRWIARKKQLYKLGLDLVDDSIPECPLCGDPWLPEVLRSLIKEEIDKAERTSQEINTIRSNIASIVREVETIRDDVVQLQDNPKTDKDLITSLARYAASLAEVIEAFKNENDSFQGKVSTKKALDLVFPKAVIDKLDKKIEAIATDRPELSRDERISIIATAAERLRELRDADKAHNRSLWISQFAKSLLDAFDEANDQVLESLYDSIQSRFADLYRLLNPDEQNFRAKFQSTGSGLELKVDFHNRGIHPPLAMHSEGHQDSMGICLFLALSERISQSALEFFVLDDVVMSVDAGHRRNVCSMLSSAFPERQFIITTHDQTWARQLVSEGVVSSDNVVRFYGWDVEAGPRIKQTNDQWADITYSVETNDIPVAASRLRRFSEEFFSDACEKLKASVVFKTNSQYDLGDLLSPALKRFNEKLLAAEKTARKQGKVDLEEEIAEKRSQFVQLRQRLFNEQWVINPAVHYNHWHTLEPADFQPVMDALNDVMLAMKCPSCGGTLFLTESDRKDADLRCHCGSVVYSIRG